MERRQRGIIGRFRALIGGFLSVWIKDRESQNPRAVYEGVIRERTAQYGELKQAVAGILYMRNKLEAEISERRSEVAQTMSDVKRAVERGDDDVALELIAHKDNLVKDMERAQAELAEVASEAETAKGNLVRFRGEIQALEREKVRIMAALANARARRRIQEAFDGLSLDSDVRALENVREQVAKMRMEGRVDLEMGDTGLQTRIRQIREETRIEGARRELDELKRRMRPSALPVYEPEKTEPEKTETEKTEIAVAG